MKKKKLTIFFPAKNGHFDRTYVAGEGDVKDVQVFPEERACVVTFETGRSCYYNMPHVFEEDQI